MAVLACSLLGTACSGGDSSAQQPSPVVTGGTPSPAASPSPLPLKPVLAGLLDRSGPPPAPLVSAFGGFVANVYWRDLQPTPGAAIPGDNAIDHAIAALDRLDSTARMGIKVRVYAGVYAPDWVKSLGGAPVAIVDPVTGKSGTIGRFWTDAFGAAYDDLQAKLAARYDSAPEVREVTISRCSTAYPEPFIRDVSSPTTVHALLAAGFTIASDQRCHREEIVSHLVWAQTRSDLSLNPYQVVDDSGRVKGDEAFTDQMMGFCRSTLGARCVLANNSLRTPLQYPDMYDQIHSLGPPIAFQTAVMAKVGNLSTTIGAAVSLGANSLELPVGYQSLPLATLSRYDARLRANAALLPA